MDDQSFDVIIAGAGAAGCVLASRLSEVPEKRVLLIEAGADAPAEEEPADIRDPFPTSLGSPRLRWPNLIAETGVDPGDGKPRASGYCIQGYGVGGGSNINGMIAFRGQPADYDGWRNHGAVGWGWDDVLPYFKKLERDLDFSGPLHGDSGPMPVRRILPRDWAPFSKAMGAALARRGYALIEDCNADFRDGVSAVPMSNLPDRRVSASMAYLTKSVRRRPNLTILTDAFVERLDIRGSCVRGVAVRTASGLRHFFSRETIVSCGAVYSPALLMRSGIGPGQHLRALGIEVIRDLAGVGRNLQNKAKVDLAVYLPRASVQPRGQRAIGQNFLRYSSQVEGCDDHDMGIKFVNKTSWHPLGRRIGAIAVCLHKPYSKGSVELASVDPAVAPCIRFNVLSDRRDFDRLVGGLRLALDLLADKEVALTCKEVFLPDGKIVARLNNPNRWNWLQAFAIDVALRTPFVRRALLKSSTLDIRALVRNEDALRALVRRYAALGWHVSGTCKIGSDDDPSAVVDTQCYVRGIDGLRVVDASIFPTTAGEGGMHFSVLMVAEKMADEIKSQWLNGGVGNRLAATLARSDLSLRLVPQ